jgi:hypothetical protein
MKPPFSTRELPLVLDREAASTRRARYDFPGMKSVDRAPREEILHRAYASGNAKAIRTIANSPIGWTQKPK